MTRVAIGLVASLFVSLWLPFRVDAQEPVEQSPEETEAMAPAEPSPAARDVTTAIDALARSMRTLMVEIEAERSANRVRIEALEQGGAAPGGGGGENNAALQAEVQSLRAEVEELRSSQQGLEESIVEQLSEMLTLAGETTSAFIYPSEGESFFANFRVSLLMNAQITEFFRFYGEVEFEEAARVGEGSGENGHILIEQAFMDFTLAQPLALRFGVMAVPFGYYNRVHEEWRYPFHARPAVNINVFPSTYSDVGAMLFGDLVATQTLRLSYEVAVVNGLTGEIGTGIGAAAHTHEGGEEHEGGSEVSSIGAHAGFDIGLRGARPAYNRDNNSEKAFVGRIGALISDVLTVGTSGYYGVYDSAGHGDRAIAMGGLDAQLALPQFTARVEGIYAHVDEGHRVFDHDGNSETPQIEVPLPDYLAGFVAEMDVRFWPKFLNGTILGRFEDPQFFVGGRLDFVEGGFETKRHEWIMSGAIGYRPIYRSALRIEYSKGVGSIELADEWRLMGSLSLGF